MNVAFAGTPEFARVAMASLQAAGFRIGLVLTQPDRPAGRGMKFQALPVKSFAMSNGFEIEQPRSLRLDGKFGADAEAARRTFERVRPDVLIVAAYGLILPQWLLDLPRLGCINIHASLLPRWRGAAPIHRAIEAGDASTGITIMQMDAGLDTGDTLLARAVPIQGDDTTATLHDKLAALGGRMIVEALELASSGSLVRKPQPIDGVTYAHKIEKSEAEIDWHDNAKIIERRLRAFDPFPGAASFLSGEIIKCWRGEVVAPDESPDGANVAPRAVSGTEPVPGQVLGVDDTGITVACGEGALKLTELQRPSGKRLAAAPFLHGKALAVGMVFGHANN
jgi:methionyl-tRNA formyltransferase